MKQRNRAILLGVVGVLCILASVFALTQQRVRTAFQAKAAMAQMALSEREDVPGRTYFNQLDETQRQAYGMILAKIEDHPAEILIPVLDTQGLDKVFRALSYDNPALLCLGSTCKLILRGGVCYFVPAYSGPADTCRALTGELEQAAGEILAQMPAGLDDYAKELFLHDAIVRRCSYRSQQDEFLLYTAYGALCEGEASCEGYARAFQLLLGRVEIPNHLIVGRARDLQGKTDGHMWNLVTIGGQPYHVDATWDDPVGQGGGICSRIYFNLTDRQISGDHFDWSPADRVCTAQQDNFFVRSGLLFSGYGEQERSTLTQAFVQAAQRGEARLEIRFADMASFSQANEELFGQEKIYRLIKRANLSLPDGKKLQADTVSYYPIPGMQVLSFQLLYA